MPEKRIHLNNYLDSLAKSLAQSDDYEKALDWILDGLELAGDDVDVGDYFDHIEELIFKRKTH